MGACETINIATFVQRTSSAGARGTAYFLVIVCRSALCIGVVHDRQGVLALLHNTSVVSRYRLDEEYNNMDTKQAKVYCGHAPLPLLAVLDGETAQ